MFGMLSVLAKLQHELIMRIPVTVWMPPARVTVRPLS